MVRAIDEATLDAVALFVTELRNLGASSVTYGDLHVTFMHPPTRALPQQQSPDPTPESPQSDDDLLEWSAS